MDMKIKEFIKLNRHKISSVYNIACSSGDYVVYILLKTGNCERLDLLSDARDCVLSYPYVDECGLEKEIERCIGQYVEI
jgi:hypothetical protein